MMWHMVITSLYYKLKSQNLIGQWVQTCSYKMIKFWGFNSQHCEYSWLYSFIFLKAAKRVDLKGSHHKKEMALCDMMAVLGNTTEVIILQYISVSNQHIVHIKLAQCYMSIISQ